MRYRPPRGRAGVALLLLLVLTWGCGIGADAPPTPMLPSPTAPAAGSATAGTAAPTTDTPGGATAPAATLPPTTAAPGAAGTATNGPAPGLATGTATIAAPPPPSTATATAAPPPVLLGDLPRYAIDPLSFLGPDGDAAMTAAGAQLVRVGLQWSAIEPQNAQPAAYHLTIYDDTLRRLAAAGLQAIGVLTGCPAWACTDSAGPIDKVSPARYAAFGAAMAARYSRPPYNVHVWEIFNEPDTTNPPNHQGAWGLHGDQYAALLKATTPRLRAVDPHVRVLLGGLGDEWFMDEQPPGPFNRNFLRDVVGAGGGPYFDYLNFHYYPQNPHFPSIADKALALRRQAAALGLAKPVICTEVGLTSSPDPRWQAPNWPTNSDAVQARFLPRAFVEGMAGGLTTITWFTLHDWTNPNPGLGIFLQTGLTREDWTPKPALQAYRTLTQEVGARRFAQRLDAAALGADGVDGYAFGTLGDEVWVIWSRGDTPVTVAPANHTIRRAVGLTGAPAAVAGGAIQAGPDPIYLEMH